jgi:hypothetical protein
MVHTGNAETPEKASTCLGDYEPKAFKEEAHEQKKNPMRVLNHYRLKQLGALYRSRGGFREGCRSYAIRLYCQFKRGRENDSHEEIRHGARWLSARCVPPFSITECDSAFNWSMVGKRRKAFDTSISDWLDITPEEEAHLARECGALPSTWKRAAKYYPGGVRPVEAPKPSRNEKGEKRRKLIAAFLESKRPDSPTIAETRAYLLNNGIDKVGKGTLMKDMRHLGWTSSRHRPTPTPD